MIKLGFILCMTSFLALAAEPWTAKELMAPAALAERLKKGEKPVMLYVGPAYLWRVKHITHSQNAGMASKPEGMESLKQILKDKSKDTEIIVYCGCCPMNVCPNIRPAMQWIKQAGFTKVKLLELPTRLADDWVAKGYPAEAEK